MAIDIRTLIDGVLEKTGGYIDQPADKGGPAKFGINQATLSRFLERPVSPDEVKALDIGTARDIYELRYYRIPRIDKLPDAIQAFVFDSAITHGPRRAIRFVQQVCNDAGLGTLATDGLIGPKTEAVAATCYAQMQDWMMTALVHERQLFCRNIAASDRSQAVFLNGWLRHANSFLQHDA